MPAPGPAPGGTPLGGTPRAVARRLLPGLLVLLAARPELGCLPEAELRSARILDPGKLEALAALAPARDPRHDLGQVTPVPWTSTTPRGALPGVGIAYGVGYTSDLELLLFPIGGRLGLRRGLLQEPEDLVSLSIGLSLSGFGDLLTQERCQSLEQDEGEVDGCFTERRWGGQLELPVVVSQRMGTFGWYTGLKIGLLWLASDLSYADSQGVFPDLVLSKEVRQWTGNAFAGVEVHATDRFVLVTELQILSSLNDARKLVYYLVPGLAVRVPLR